jgi:hypothetical protein
VTIGNASYDLYIDLSIDLYIVQLAFFTFSNVYVEYLPYKPVSGRSAKLMLLA